jgi:hypothetical protein
LSKNSKISPGNKNTGDIRRQTDSHRRERERKKKFEIGECQEVKLRIKIAKMECFLRFSVARIRPIFLNKKLPDFYTRRKPII